VSLRQNGVGPEKKLCRRHSAEETRSAFPHLLAHKPHIVLRAAWRLNRPYITDIHLFTSLNFQTSSRSGHGESRLSRRKCAGCTAVNAQVRSLTRRMAQANPLWG
jgi:hypothetical protein